LSSNMLPAVLSTCLKRLGIRGVQTENAKHGGAEEVMSLVSAAVQNVLWASILCNVSAASVVHA
jgi:hypothetical protein